MKNRFLRYAAATVAATALAGVLVGCGSQQPAGSAGSAGSAAVAPTAVITCSIDDIDYANIFFDYTDQIASEMAAVAMVPQAAAIELTAADANGATGVMIIPSIDAANTTDYYMNAYVAGNTINFAGGIASAESSVNGALPVAGGALAYVPAAIDGKTLADEVITFTMASGAVYKVHMIPETFPAFEIIGDGVAADNAGVYSFALDKFFVRVNTAGELIYYRNMNHIGELQVENFAPQPFGENQYYSAFVELHKDFRNAQGGFSSFCYLSVVFRLFFG